MTFREHGVRMTIGPLSQQFTRRITARWSLATNALGEATSYRVRWTTNTVGQASVAQERLVTSLSDTMTIAEPLRPDSVTVRVSVWARRRGLESIDSVYSVRGFGRADAPPPPPGPVIIDTTQVAVDSVALFGSAATLQAQAPLGRDTMVVCAYARAGGQWYRGSSAIMVKAVTLTPNTVRLDAFERGQPSPTYCATALLDRLAVVAADSFMPIEWQANQVVDVGTPDGDGQFSVRRYSGGFRAVADGRVSGTAAPRLPSAALPRAIAATNE